MIGSGPAADAVRIYHEHLIAVGPGIGAVPQETDETPPPGDLHRSIEITSVEVEHPGVGSRHYLLPWEGLTVHVAFEATEPVEGVVFALEIYDQEGRLIFGSDTEILDRPFDAPVGAGTRRPELRARAVARRDLQLEGRDQGPSGDPVRQSGAGGFRSDEPGSVPRHAWPWNCTPTSEPPVSTDEGLRVQIRCAVDRWPLRTVSRSRPVLAPICVIGVGVVVGSCVAGRRWFTGCEIARVRTGAPTPTFTLTWSTGPLADQGQPIAESSPVVATLDGVGPAVVVGDRSGLVYAYHLADGSPVRGMAGRRRRRSHRLVAVGAGRGRAGWTRCTSVPATPPIPVRAATRRSRRRAHRCGTRPVTDPPSDTQPAAGVQASLTVADLQGTAERRGRFARPRAVRAGGLDRSHARRAGPSSPPTACSPPPRWETSTARRQRDRRRWRPDRRVRRRPALPARRPPAHPQRERRRDL